MTLSQANDRLTKLYANLQYWQKRRSEEKWWKRHDENKAIREINRDIKKLENIIKKLSIKEDKFEYLSTAAENGLDPRGNIANAVGGAISSLGSSAAAIVGLASGPRGPRGASVISGPNGTTVIGGSRPDAQNMGMMSNLTSNPILLVGILVAIYLLFKRK